MSNNVSVKEMFMSSYYDAYKIKYKDEIIDIALEICAEESNSYYKGHAIKEAAITYAENGNENMADKWAEKSYLIIHCQECIYSQFLGSEEYIIAEKSVDIRDHESLFPLTRGCRIDGIASGKQQYMYGLT